MSQSTVLYDVPGPKARARNVVIGIVGGAAILAGLVYVIVGLAKAHQLTADFWMPFLQGSTWVDYLLPGLLSTLEAAVVAIVLSLILGTLLGVGRLSTVAPLRAVCGVWVEFFRAIPVLVGMLFSYYFALYVLHLPTNQAFFGVVVGLTLYNSSVIAELIRAGVGSLPKGQREAGLAIGMSEGQAMASILLPQAITAMLPSLVSQLVVVLKDTALGAIIGYPDLLQSGYTGSNRVGNLIPTVIVMAAMYIIINYSLTRVAAALERRMKRRGRSAGKPADPMMGDPAEAALSAAAVNTRAGQGAG